VAVDALSYTASYSAGKVAEKAGLPPEINVLLSLGLGITATKVAGKYITVSKADRLRIDRWKYRVY
jgi:hypothetical protein